MKLFALLLLPALSWAQTGEDISYVPYLGCPFTAEQEDTEVKKLVQQVLTTTEELSGRCQALKKPSDTFSQALNDFSKSLGDDSKLSVKKIGQYLGVSLDCKNFSNVLHEERKDSLRRLYNYLSPPPGESSKCFTGAQGKTDPQNIAACIDEWFGEKLAEYQKKCDKVLGKIDKTLEKLPNLADLAKHTENLIQNLDSCRNEPEFRALTQDALGIGIKVASMIALAEPHTAAATVGIGIGGQLLLKLVERLFNNNSSLKNREIIRQMMQNNQLACLYLEAQDKSLKCSELINAKQHKRAAPFKTAQQYYFYFDASEGQKAQLPPIAFKSHLEFKRRLDTLIDKLKQQDVQWLQDGVTLQSTQDFLSLLKEPIVHPWPKDGALAVQSATEFKFTTYEKFLEEIITDLEETFKKPEGLPVTFPKKDEIVSRMLLHKDLKQLKTILELKKKLQEAPVPEEEDLKNLMVLLKTPPNFSELIALHGDLQGRDSTGREISGFRKFQNWEKLRALEDKLEASRLTPTNLQESVFTALITEVQPKFKAELASLNESYKNQTANFQPNTPPLRSQFFRSQILPLLNHCILLAGAHHFDGNLQKSVQARWNPKVDKNYQEACQRFVCKDGSGLFPTDQLKKNDFISYVCRLKEEYTPILNRFEEKYTSTGTLCQETVPLQEPQPFYRRTYTPKDRMPHK